MLKLTRCLILLITLAALVLPASPALAWPEEPFARIILSGPGIVGSVEIADPALLEPMTITGFTDFSGTIEPPSNLGEGYVLHRYFKEQDGSYWDFDIVRYYADPAGGPGFVYYQEGIGYSPVYNAGHWFRVTPEGEAAMHRILQAVLPPASDQKPGSSKPPTLAAGAVAPWLLISVGALAIGAGTLWLKRKRLSTDV